MSQSGDQNHSGGAADTGVSGTDEDEPTAQEERTTLLSLTAELRNRIYEEVLIEPNGILVHANTNGPPVQEPGLLSTCRQIRAEARPMWWMLNNWDFVIDDCDVTNLSLVINRLYKIGMANNIRTQPEFRALVIGAPNWKNLLAWCEKVHSVGDVTPVLALGEADATGLYSVVCSATKLADQLGDLKVTWEECQSALENMRATWGFLDSRWLQ